MRTIVFPLFFILFAATLAAQNYHTAATAPEKALRAYHEGRAHAGKGEAGIALGYYEKAVRLDSLFIDARLALANNYIDLRDFFRAETAFEDAIALDSLYAPGAYWLLSQVEWQLDKYAEAAGHADTYLRRGPKNDKLRREAEHLRASARLAAEAVKRPVPFNPQNLGPGVNTELNEYFPSVTADGAYLIFTRDDAGEFFGDENFYRSAWKDSAWQPAEPLTGVNTNLNEGAQAISPDGTWLVFTACNRDEVFPRGSCDLYWSQEKKDGWTKPAPFSKAINSADWDSQPTISADGKTIIFSSRRPGGRGQEDLWFTSRQANGSWSKPQNLGPNINTGGKEQTPFLHPDGSTLYFSTDSLPGMGGSDLYFSRRQADGAWGPAQNLGYPINTKAHETALTVSLDGRTAYYATNRKGGRGGLDIYSFELPDYARPQAVTYARVRVTDANTGQILAAKVEITDLKDNQPYANAFIRKDGTALVCLPAGREYALNVTHPGYFFHSENFNLVGTATFEKPFQLDVALLPIPTAESAPVPGKAIALRNVFFETGSAALLPASTAELDRLAKLLEENPTLRIQLNGHTDNVGADAANQTLSENRARAVYDYLVGKGIAAERLRYKGFGESKPIETNDTPEGRARNRRTEFEAI